VVDETKAKELAQMIESKNFKFIAETASPIAQREINQLTFLLPLGSSPNRILLTGGEDYFKMIGDSISVDMAYFGTRQMGGPYEFGRTGVQLNVKPKLYEANYDERKKVYRLKFRAHDKRESFNVELKIFPNKRAEMYLNTSHRTAINYNGFITRVTKESKLD
jgi:hypothetical protein